MPSCWRWFAPVLLLILSVRLCADDLFVPQPYTPVTNSPAQLAEKQAALNVLRSQWSGENYSQGQISSILSANGVSDPASVSSHFNANGSWHQSLPTGAVFSAANYNLNREYFFDLIALAYLHKFQSSDQKQLIYQSLAWYFDTGRAAPHAYHETFDYLEPETTIGGEMLILGLLMFDDIHADRATDTAVEAVFQSMRAFGRAFINAAPQIRGANWSFRYENCLRYVLFTNSPADMDEYDYHWKKALGFNSWESETDGIYQDWSMMHHGDMNYWGMYGISWTDSIIDYGELFAGKPWAYGSQQLDFVANSMIEGTRWVLFRGVCEYSSAPKRGTMLLTRTDSVAESFKALYSRLINLGGNLLTRKNELVSLEASSFLPPWTTAGAAQASQPEFAGHRYFWNTEYQVHRRSNFCIDVRRCSQRIRPPEDSSVAVGTLHLNYGTGYTPIVRRGDELRFSRLCWDFQHVPGTTVEQGKTVAAGKAGSTKRGLNLFSGGVSDGAYGCGAFDMNMVEFNANNSGNYSTINGAGGLKGTYFLDDGMVALGQNIRRIATVGGTQNNILTTINNVRRLTDVVYSVDGAPPLTVSPGTPLEQQFAVSDKAWFWHDGMGYVIWPSAAAASRLVVSLGERPFNSILKTDSDFQSRVKAELGTAAWNAGVFNMFRLWIDHGVNPADDTYAYQVLPDCTVAGLQAAVASSSVQILANSNGVQAVADAAAGLYYASFFSAGTADFGQGKTMTVDRPLMVMARQTGGSHVFTASNPISRGLRRSFVPGSGTTVGTIYSGAVAVDLSGFGISNRTYFSLPSERGEEGASVRGKVDVLNDPLRVFADWEFDNLGANGRDSGRSATNWSVTTPVTSAPRWTISALGGDPESSLVVDAANSKLVLTGKANGGEGVSEAVLSFGADRDSGAVSADIGLSSGTTWTGGKFSLVHIDGVTTTLLADCNIQRNGTNASNKISTGSPDIIINGEWENVFNRVSFEWSAGMVDITVSGLAAGEIHVSGCPLLANLRPNALLIRAGSSGDTKVRKLQLQNLKIQLPVPGYLEWITGFGVENQPDIELDDDCDGDGFDNHSEFVSGTDPTNASSYFRVRDCAFDASAGDLVIRWNSVEGRLYDVFFSQNPSGPFLPIEQNIEFPRNSHTTVVDPAVPRGFFRVGVRLAP